MKTATPVPLLHGQINMLGHHTFSFHSLVNPVSTWLQTRCYGDELLLNYPV